MLWRDGTALDRFDKALTLPVARLRLPAPLELLLSVPGAFMGLPHAFLGPTPLCVATATAASAGEVNIVHLTALALFWTAGLAAFYKAGVKGAKTVMIPMILGATIALKALFSQEAAAAGFRFITASCVLVTLIIPLKNIFLRSRPAVSMNLLKDVEAMRAPQLWEYIRSVGSGNQARESMPSSDVATMSVLALILREVGGAHAAGGLLPWPALIGLVGLSAFGRLYFWAHHALDVSVGAAFGAGIFAGLRRAGLGGCARDAWVSFFVFVGVALAVIKQIERDASSTKK